MLSNADLFRIKCILFGCAEPALYARFVESLPPEVKRSDVMSRTQPKIEQGEEIRPNMVRWNGERFEKKRALKPRFDAAQPVPGTSRLYHPDIDADPEFVAKLRREAVAARVNL